MIKSTTKYNINPPVFHACYTFIIFRIKYEISKKKFYTHRIYKPVDDGTLYFSNLPKICGGKRLTNTVKGYKENFYTICTKKEKNIHRKNIINIRSNKRFRYTICDKIICTPLHFNMFSFFFSIVFAVSQVLAKVSFYNTKPGKFVDNRLQC